MIIRRAHGDTYTVAKFYQTKHRIPKDSDSYYLWSLFFNPFSVAKVNEQFIQRYVPNYTKEQIDYLTNTQFIDRQWVADIYKKLTYDKSFIPMANLYRDALINDISTPVVLLGVKDHLTPSYFDPWVEERPWLINPMLEISRHHNDKKFILLTSMENLGAYIKESNVEIIPWGGDISNHIDRYKKVDPIIGKNFQSSRSFLSLNRHNRHHRIHLVSLLLALNLADKGLISCMFKDYLTETIEDYKWQYTEQQAPILEKLRFGFNQIKNQTFSIDDHYEIYKDTPNDNVGNFKSTLSNYYQETFVEFVTETSYTESCFLITEKTANSILGCCFPIWISSKGTVEFLRSIGMDVFDDVVDHSYDSIENPVDRLYHAVTDNLELLVDVERAKQLWQQHQQRFLQNVEFFRTQLWQFYNTRFSTALNKLSF